MIDETFYFIGEAGRFTFEAAAVVILSSLVVCAVGLPFWWLSSRRGGAFAFRFRPGPDFVPATVAWGTFAVSIALATWLREPGIFLLGSTLTTVALLMVAGHRRRVTARLTGVR